MKEMGNKVNEPGFPEWMSRTVQLLGARKCEALREAHVLVVGLGGVGSAAAESLARSGIGKISLVDSDLVQASNINRQIPALHSTIGKAKVEVMEARLKDINPDIQITSKAIYLDENNLDSLLKENYDYIIDAIDTLAPKILFIERIYKMGLPFTSSMGSGGKTDPTKIGIADFKKTYNCRLAYLLRKKLRKLGVNGGFKVVFSTELTNKELLLETDNEPNKKSILGTVPYIPTIFGAMLASLAVEAITTLRE